MHPTPRKDRAVTQTHPVPAEAAEDGGRTENSAGLLAVLQSLSPDGLVHGCACGRTHPYTPSALDADPARWRRIRAGILRRDKRRCQWKLSDGQLCGAHATDCGHRFPRSLGGCDSPANLEAQCRAHNRSDGASLGNAMRTVVAAVSSARTNLTDSNDLGFSDRAAEHDLSSTLGS